MRLSFERFEPSGRQAWEYDSVCPRCGREFLAEDSIEICDRCRAELRVRFSELLSRFSETELRYLDCAAEGVSLFDLR